MSNIVVITDSSCDYSPEQAAAAGFSMVPLTVYFGEEQFLEGLELTPAQFYRRLAKMGWPAQDFAAQPGNVYQCIP